MNNLVKILSSIILVLSLCLLISCNNSDVNEPNNNPVYGAKTRELISIVENNPTIKSLLIKSIAQAKLVNPDNNTNPAQTLEEYYQFVTWAETCMP